MSILKMYTGIQHFQSGDWMVQRWSFMAALSIWHDLGKVRVVGRCPGHMTHSLKLGHRKNDLHIICTIDVKVWKGKGYYGVCFLGDGEKMIVIGCWPCSVNDAR